MRDYGIEGAFPGIRSDMQFIQNEAVERQSLPRPVVPREVASDKLRRAMYALGLEARSWVRQILVVPSLRLPVHTKEIARVGSQIVHDAFVVAITGGFQALEPAGGTQESHAHADGVRSPHSEAPGTGPHLGGSVFPTHRRCLHLYLYESLTDAAASCPPPKNWVTPLSSS